MCCYDETCTYVEANTIVNWISIGTGISNYDNFNAFVNNINYYFKNKYD